MYYINTLERELVDTNAYKLQSSLSERVVVDGHGCHTALHFGIKAKENKTMFLRYTGYLNSIKPHIKQDVLLVLVPIRQQNFPQDVPRSTSYGVYISQLIRFARASSYVTDFNTRNKLLTQKLLKQGYRYHKLRKTFSKFYRRYFDLISKFQVGLKSLLRQGLSEPDFYGDLVYKLKKIVGINNFSAQFIKIISHYKKIGYNINVLQQTACLVVNPITVGNFAFLFNCMPVGRTSDSMKVPT